MNNQIMIIILGIHIDWYIPFCRVDSREDKPFVEIQQRKMNDLDVDGLVFAVRTQCCAIESKKKN